MVEIIFWTGVNRDGTGDFTHCIDLFLATRDHEALKGQYNFTLVIEVGDRYELLDESWKKHYARFKQKLSTLNLPEDRCYFGTSEELTRLLNTEEFKARCQSVQQHITLSNPTGLLVKKYIAPDATVKYIGEHESGIVDFGEQVLLRGMGLAPRKYGIKIATVPDVSRETALSTLQQHAPEFWNALTTSTHSKDSAELMEKNLLVPAYFYDHFGLSRFLLLMSCNAPPPPDKDILIYLSSVNDGKRMKDVITRSTRPISSRMTSVKEIELIEKDEGRIVSETIKINPEGKVMRIFCNFRINDEAFDALYHIAPVVGVAGDCSFERAMAFRVLPFYFSGNYSLKRQTLVSLQKIIEKAGLDIPESIQRDFITYFKCEENYWLSPAGISDERIAELLKMDLKGMMAEWPKVANYLKEHFNLYNWLPELMKEQANKSEPELDDIGTRNPIVDVKADLELPKVSALSLFAAADSNPPVYSAATLKFLSGFQ